MLFWFLILNIVFLIKCIRIKDQITVELSDINHYCFRLLNGSTTVGCQSKQTGNTGAIALIKNLNDLNNEIEKLPLGINSIIAVVYIQDFKQNLIDKLKDFNNVSGILLIDADENKPKQFSEDSICPNNEFSAYFDKQNIYNNTCKWNQYGAIHSDGFRFLSLDKPIFLIRNKSEINILIENCYHTFNKKYSNLRCAAKMTQFMHAAGNAKICKRRNDPSFKICDVLEDKNIISILPALNCANESSSLNIFMLAARMDSFSTFAFAKNGDFSAITSIIALLAVADAVGQNLPLFTKIANDNKKQLVLAFFHGESLGYIGSSRMVWEMKRNIFPFAARNFSNQSSNIMQINLNNIKVYMELQQLQNSKFFTLHSNPEVLQNNLSFISNVSEFIQKLTKEQQYELFFFNKSLFPPSSFHSILKETKNIPGLLLTSFKEAYQNGYINSILDTNILSNETNLTELIDYIETAANISFQTVLNFFYQNQFFNNKNFYINRTYIETLVNCFFNKKFDCVLFQKILNSTTNFLNARSLYIGTSHEISLIRILVQKLLVQSLGEKWPTPNVSTESQCNDLNNNQDVYNFVWQIDPTTNKPFCHRTTTYRTNALSPAFDEIDYDFQSGKYSTWMESVWEAHSRLEIYLKPDYKHDLYAIGIALFVILASIPLKLFITESFFLHNTEPYTSSSDL